jgi:hypothetical protein
MPLVLLGLWATFGGYGFWIAKIKRRSSLEGLALGLLLGPAGCFVAASLRERMTEELEEAQARLHEEALLRQEAERERQAALQAEAARRQVEAQERAEAARVRRAEAYSGFCDWFDEAILKFGWYKALPEVAQPIVIGLLVALPLVIVTILVFGRR